MIPVFQQAVPVLQKFEEGGYEAYFVGGSVRDLLLQKEIHDVDIATSANPEEIKGIFSKTVDVGIEHGTVMVLYNGQAYEVTTFRSESGYTDFRRPDEVTFIRSLQEDLGRRDFTMNAIAMNKDGKIFDPFSGEKAIKAKVIETVGKASERFTEDALRMMRAVRFVSQLSFSIEESTYLSLREYAHLLNHIAIERISIEFEKLLLGKNVQKAIGILLDTGLYQYLPGLKEYGIQLNTFGRLNLNTALSLEEKWTLLLHQFGLQPLEAVSFLKNWKLTNKKIKRIKKGLELLNWRLHNDWCAIELYSAKEEFVLSIEKLVNVIQGKDVRHGLDPLKQLLESLPIKDRSELALTGKELIEWFHVSGGPWIEEKLQKIEKAIVTNELSNTKESIKEWLLSCNQT